MKSDSFPTDGSEIPGQSGNRFKVLVIDDEPDLADISSALLHCHGFESTAVYSAADALEFLISHPDTNAIFSDVLMPGMNGLELAESVLVLYPSIKVVLTSGFTTPDFWDNQSRPFLFAPKPYSIDRVISLLMA